MKNLKDLNTCYVVTPISRVKQSDPEKTIQIGASIISYEVRMYKNLCNLGNKQAYQVLCTHRIIIPNKTAYLPGPHDEQTFADYPAIIMNNIKITPGSGDIMTSLINYSPRTLNAAVVTTLNRSSDSGASASLSHQHASGSSTSQSNSFGASANLGFFGSFMGGVSGNYEHASGSGHYESSSADAEAGSDSAHSWSSGESMSVKDWACYAFLDDNDQTPTWIWGQEYPWDMIQFRQRKESGSDQIDLPHHIRNLLFDGTFLYPPSQPALFGIDFTMKSVWLLEGNEAETVTLKHELTYCTASHSIAAGELQANLRSPETFSFESPDIDLNKYGLDSLSGDNPDKTAIVGFIPGKFQVKPAVGTQSNPARPFKMISANNNLLVKDATIYPVLNPSGTSVSYGFSAQANGLNATFSTDCLELNMTLYFKIADTVHDYVLFVKHWVTGSTGVALTLVINDDVENTIRKTVNNKEAEGGENNLLSISLRNHYYSSVNYHDYLNLGLNSIKISISPESGVYVPDCGYQVRAISIEGS